MITDESFVFTVKGLLMDFKVGGTLCTESTAWNKTRISSLICVNRPLVAVNMVLSCCNKLASQLIAVQQVDAGMLHANMVIQMAGIIGLMVTVGALEFLW